jgi:hypothetical protein
MAQDDPIQRAMDAAGKPAPTPAYDKLKINSLLSGARVYANMPGGEMVSALVEQLRFSQDEIAKANERVHRAETDLIVVKNDLEKDRRIYDGMRLELETLRSAAEIPSKPVRPAKLKVLPTPKAGKTG